MKFFIDTADIKEIREAARLGILDGVTTNPSLVAKTGRDYRSLVQEICEICPGPVSAEVLACDYEGMMKEARSWVKVAPNVVVKIPLIADGIKAVATCSKEGIPTNVTLCFQPLQALVAAKAGASYISPFVGRLDDIGQNGMDVIAEIKAIYTQYQYKTEVLVASVRHLGHLLEAARLGADVATIPFSIFGQLIHHPLTDKGLEKFMQDARQIPQG